MGYSPWGRKELDTTERLTFLTFYSLLCSGRSPNFGIRYVGEVYTYSTCTCILSCGESLTSDHFLSHDSLLCVIRRLTSVCKEV